MAHFFISYSRVDSPFVELFMPKVKSVYRRHTFWHDAELRGGDAWWDEIIRQIARSDVFVYLMSNDSIQSEYCQREYQEALRLQKKILPIQIRARTQIPEVLRRLQYVDLSGGVNDANGMNSLHAAIQEILADLPATPPEPLSPEPLTKPEVKDQPAPAWYRDPRFIIGSIAVPLLVAVIGWALFLAQNPPQATPTPTAVALVGTPVPTTDATGGAPTDIVTATVAPTDIVTATDAPTDTETPRPTDTETPVILSEAEIEASVQAEMNLIFAEVQQTEQAAATNTAVRLTVNAQQTIYAQQTADAQATQIALSWTPTPTVDTRATAQARITETVVAATVTQAWINSWTATPTPTLTPSNTPTVTPTNTPTYTPTNTPTPTITPSPTATQAPLEIALQRAQAGVTTNAEWQAFYPNGFVQDFDGVPMVLVPAGCFEMGENGEGGRQCFEPFWIGQTEMTQADFTRLGGTNNSTFEGDNRPVESITWNEAWAFAQAFSSGACGLPTEAQWEYAARGPDGLVYPWGNEWVAENAVTNETSNSQTADVGSREGGMSWVGAQDLSGNVWEWTRSAYADYPYNANDGRENASSTNSRVLRGGSWAYDVSRARAVSRSLSFPLDRGYSRGFRVVVCRPS
jgi:formylglycine-generating enzyme required for sulfatase activity